MFSKTVDDKSLTRLSKKDSSNYFIDDVLTAISDDNYYFGIQRLSSRSRRIKNSRD